MRVRRDANGRSEAAIDSAGERRATEGEAGWKGEDTDGEKTQTWDAGRCPGKKLELASGRNAERPAGQDGRQHDVRSRGAKFSQSNGS